MAADKTANKSAHVTLAATTAYTVNLTGNGNVVKMTGHHHGSGDNIDIYYVIRQNEADLPTLTAGMDDSFVLHPDTYTITGKPLRDCWVRLISTHAIDVSVELHIQARS